MAPKISIIITNYNYARFLSCAIDSVLSQHYANKELIVVDDGSTDNSLAVASAYGGRLHLIQQENKGQAAAGYAGFCSSQGEIVLFLDADDCLRPDALLRIADAWRSDCTKVQYDLAIIDGDGRDLGRRFCNFSEDYNADRVREDFRQFGIYTSPVMSGNAYSRWFLEQVLPLSGVPWLDSVLIPISPIHGDVITISETLGCYRLHGGNFDNQGTGASDSGRFVKSIARRYQEIEMLRQHAEKNGVVLPDGNLLDNDLVFINYRLMLKKQGIPYQNCADDHIGSLVRRALFLIRRKPTSVTSKFSHMLWFLVFAALPRMLVVPAIQLRFNRARYLKLLRLVKG